MAEVEETSRIQFKEQGAAAAAAAQVHDHPDGVGGGEEAEGEVEEGKGPKLAVKQISAYALYPGISVILVN
eukprot:15206802-Heterocapsa_arctica.AAC.1